MMRNHILLVTGFMACLFIGTAVAAPDGYLLDTEGNIVRNGSGECLHTGDWTPAMAAKGCDGATTPSPKKYTSPPAIPATDPSGQFDALEHSASPHWAVNLSITPNTVAVGSHSIKVNVRSAHSGYLTILQRGTDGKEDVVFPNALDNKNRIKAGKPIVLPHKNWQWTATPPTGEGRLLAIVSKKPVDTQTLQSSLSGQTYGAAAAAYLEH